MHFDDPLNPLVPKAVQAHAARFLSGDPFHHVVIDDFFKPEIAEAMLVEFPSVRDTSTLVNEFGDPNPKSAVEDVRSIGGIYTQIDDYIRHPEFLSLMSQITGIRDLRYDPYYFGAGTHENFHGAGLDPHFDFNFHPKTAQHRRINAIVYLNKNWDPAWKGALRLHSDPWDLKNDRIIEIQPVFNRCVIFGTTERSWHSVPPVRLPADKRHLSRKSFTIYLYTDARPLEELAPPHGTVYVQPTLSPHIKAGRVLTHEDEEEIYSNLKKRNSYLRNLYKREYDFSYYIDRQKTLIRELQRTSYIPLLGYAIIQEVQSPLFPDRFMGTEVRFLMNALRPISAVHFFGYRPEAFDGSVNVSLAVNAQVATQTAQGGVFRIDLDFSNPVSGPLEVAISASAVQRPPAISDERHLSIIVDRIELVH